MTGTLVSDVAITFTKQRWACVLDPALALSVYGLPLVKQLSERMELWIVREFWHMLDNPQFYVEQPETLLGKDLEALSPAARQQVSQQMLRSLQEWERLRLRVDPTTRNINFLADVIGESCVPVGVDDDLIWRWESLAQSLDNCMGEPFTKADTLTLAYRDLAALAAARPACILTHRSTEAAQFNVPPTICGPLQQWGIASQEVKADDKILAAERAYLCEILVHAGLSKLLWSGLNLIVLHLMVPAAATISQNSQWDNNLAFSELDEPSNSTPIEAMNLWQDAQGFWYAMH